MIEKIYNLKNEELDQKVLEKINNNKENFKEEEIEKLKEKIKENSAKMELDKLLKTIEDNNNLKTSLVMEEMYKQGFKDGSNLILDIK